jgi:hypothetical protein
VRAYEVSVAPGGALAADAPPTEGGLAKGPYVAETYPVSIDREYVLIEVDA